MEYVQGNSIATMLARKEGFSIWDLLDIGRQLCSGLDYAASQNVVHYSLEPSKIMCGWDGTVRILSFGVSSVGNFVQHVPEGLPTILHYMSPEQVQGQTVDARSNLFSLGAMFYEMVTERKAFDRDDIESLAAEHSGKHARSAAPCESESASSSQRSDHEGAGEGSGGALSERTATARRSGEVQRVEDAGGEEARGASGRGSYQDSSGRAIEVHRVCRAEIRCS